MTTQIDLVVIGAGPAGLAAAATAADHDLDVVIIDEQSSAGGQIYRSANYKDSTLDAVLGSDYVAGRELLAVVTHPRVTHLGDATVWDITRDRQVFYSQNGKAGVFKAGYVVIATGAMERPTPFVGWHLPGVMTAGAGQIMLKTSGILPRAPLVLAGGGPLLLLLAAQYLRAGQPIEAIVQTTAPANVFAAAKHATGIMGKHGYLKKGLELFAEIRKHQVAFYKGATELEAHGESELESVSFRQRGKSHSFNCQTLMVHAGVIPSVQLTQLLEIEHRFDVLQRCWTPVTDDNGETNLPGVAVAGDSASIAGAEAAELRGTRSGLTAARKLGKIDSAELTNRIGPIMRELRRYEKARPFLDALYAPSREFLSPADDAMVCRCEEVKAGTIREYVELGCLGPNQTKAFGRTGMGPCQGRMCGLTVSEIIAEKRNVSMQEVGTYRVRAPIKPITVGEMASMADRIET